MTGGWVVGWKQKSLHHLVVAHLLTLAGHPEFAVSPQNLL
jgi:hypothetical protein